MDQIDELMPFMKHLPHCNTMQDWTHAQQVLSNNLDGPDKGQAALDMQKMINTCTCGLDRILKRLDESKENWRDIESIINNPGPSVGTKLALIFERYHPPVKCPPVKKS